METLLIIALLASNVWLIRKVLKKPETPPAGKEVADSVENSAPPDPSGAAEAPTEVIGKSNFDVGQFMDSFREIAKEAATEAAKEVVPLIIKEIGTPADAGFPDIPEEKPTAQIPVDKLDEIFSTHSVSELTGETPPPADANAEGIDFDELQSTMKVLKDKPHTDEDEKIARRVLPELEGTEIIEYVKLDPVVRKRILMIECQLPDTTEENDNPPEKSDDAAPKKKIVFHADIDTTDIDAIDFNIFH